MKIEPLIHEYLFMFYSITEAETFLHISEFYNSTCLGKYDALGPIGFGYDSLSDDYKVVLGSRGGPWGTSFIVLSLKTNAWKYVGHLRCTLLVFKFVGALCNGAIHWLMKGADRSKHMIIAFNLSTEEFKEIPLPDHGCTKSSRLGIIDGCLCLCQPVIGDLPRWVMKSYNVKSSWTLLPPYDHVPHKVNDAIHTLKSTEDDYVPHTSFFTDDDDDKIELRYKEPDLCAPIFVQSLVSPHVYRRLKRKREPTNNHKLGDF